jgi:hypothetical protein
MLCELLRRFSRRPAVAPDFGPLPTREWDDGRERVVIRSDGTREHWPSRATRVLPEPPLQSSPHLVVDSDPKRARPVRASEILLAATRRSPSPSHDGTEGPR